jgi:hypothetical protein
MIASASADDTAILWNVISGEEIRSFIGHTEQIGAIAFSDDANHIMTGSFDLTVRIWDIETGETIRYLTGHTTPISAVAFDPAGDYVFTADNAKSFMWLADLENVIGLACNRLPRDFRDDERVLYNIMDDAPTCSQGIVDPSIVETTWTPFPAQVIPIWTPIPLEPLDEVVEFVFLTDRSNYDDYAMPALDVYQTDGAGLVSRIPELNEATLSIPLYSAAENVPADLTPPFELGPWPQGAPLDFTLRDWISAEGRGTFTARGDRARLDVAFNRLIPNGVYTLWCNAVTTVPALGLLEEAPCGAPNGSENTFIADADGHAEFSVEMDTLPPNTERRFLSVGVAYHSDGQTYGYRPGEFGKNVHVQMYYDFLPADS